ncbi:hypothetical protein OG905_00730 [Streptomyces sp. NBC_00322]|uniref:hypothetical protein n=1 Tax=Streptomyces sp. NBC_00322 TaxID=2975712 RepID=UPI002E2DE27C|nr:hypothetical protein [Streptomyces sp. NBC_00322]
MSETYARDGRRLFPWKRRFLGVLVVLDAIITLLPQLYWAAGSSGRASTVLLYSVGGSVFVVASLMVMYAIGGPGSSNGVDHS